MSATAPHLVFLSGSVHAGSRADRIAQWCARQCPGATSTAFTGGELEFPFYRAGAADPAGRVRRYLAELAAADGVVLISPSYHGTLSGLLKNALDYVNELAGERRPFLEGRPVGCVAVSSGEQGAASTVATLRTIGHALRGWPTPLGVTLHGDLAEVRVDGEPVQAEVRTRLGIMLDQVLTLATHHAERRRQLGPVAAAGPVAAGGPAGAGGASSAAAAGAARIPVGSRGIR
jgi:FMN reductase